MQSRFVFVSLRIFLKYFPLSPCRDTSCWEGKSLLVVRRNCFICLRIFFSSFLFLTIEISLCQRRIGRIFGGRDESFLSLWTKANLSNPDPEKSGRVIFQRREKGHAYQLFRSPVSCLRISRETARFPPFDRSFLFPSLSSSSSSSSSSREERWMTHDHPRAQGENALYFRTTRSKRPGRKSGKGRCVYVF